MYYTIMLSYFGPSKYPLIDRYKDRLSLFSPEELTYLLELQKTYKTYDAVITKHFAILDDKSIFSFFAMLGLYVQILSTIEMSKNTSLQRHDIASSYPYDYILSDLNTFKINIIHLKEHFLDNPDFLYDYFNFNVKSQEAIDVLLSFFRGNTIEQRVLGKCFLVGIDNDNFHTFYKEDLKDLFGKKYQDLCKLRDKYIKVFIEKYATFFNQALPLEHATPSACEHTAVCLYEILDKSLGLALNRIQYQKQISEKLGLRS